MKEYTVKKLASIAGVTPRTLRHYDKIDLLVPLRRGTGDYRVYTEKEVDRLQEILLYRELGMELSLIKEILDRSKVSRKSRLKEHYKELLKKKADLDLLIKNVENTIKAEKGVEKMSDDKKFEGLKKDIIDQNENKFGDEIREKWSDETIDESNEKMMKMSKEDFEDLKKMAAEINERLEHAVKSKIDTDSEEALAIAELHKKWLNYSWPDYDPDAHLGLVEMYLTDDRFKGYYDSNVEGCAKFLRDAVIAMIVKEDNQ